MTPRAARARPRDNLAHPPTKIAVNTPRPTSSAVMGFMPGESSLGKSERQAYPAWAAGKQRVGAAARCRSVRGAEAPRIELEEHAPHRRRIAGEDHSQIGVAQPVADDLREDVAVVERDAQVLPLIELLAREPRPVVRHAPARRRCCGPSRTCTLPWPWSVPWLPFSRSVAPNSDITTSVTSSACGWLPDHVGVERGERCRRSPASCCACDRWSGPGARACPSRRCRSRSPRRRRRP